MVLTGGGALLQNLDKMLTQVTGVPCVVAEEPLLCVARGTGIALDNLEEYKRRPRRGKMTNQAVGKGYPGGCSERRFYHVMKLAKGSRS